MADLEALSHKRDQLRKEQVRDRAKQKHLRELLAKVGGALERRRNRIENLARRIRKAKERHPHGVDQAGLDFIATHEGEVRHNYNDGAGNCTACVGHLISMSPCSGTKTYTHEECMDWLLHDVQVAVEAIKKLVTVDLNQYMFNALASIVFNIGTGNFASSTLLRLLNQKDYNGAADQFLRWVYDSAGNKEPGLITRREDERRLFLK